MSGTTRARGAGTKGVPRADREDQILRAAAETFGLQGYAATSVADVAARAGISKPLVYAYFGSKEGLLTASLHHSGAILVDEIERIAVSGVVGLERALRTLEGIFGLLEEQPWLWRLFFDATVPRTDESVAAELAFYTDRITALAHDGVSEMLALGGNTDPTDVSAMTAVWMGIVDSLVNWWLDHPDESAAAMTERSVRLFVAALAVPLPESVQPALRA
ncbi:TetR/AcrR family transcriptional regulator [Nocardioides sp. Kera G14]|uniref:TetR/AcrR family transcriptional regulator n=1 Tax=Nocardioides sp. Kera G14 TaxID=2884264 RepID=UPI001D121998|nr:TetR/AcrR family transcriptional regulator [Nocardioides sp. Kera G14]UDY23530.1 TetR/AcrR family transcriptional regulator [Nocardioides sp. Kera G14]